MDWVNKMILLFVQNKQYFPVVVKWPISAKTNFNGISHKNVEKISSNLGFGSINDIS